MDDHDKIWLVARSLVSTHREKAPRIARSRARECGARADDEGGKVWRDVSRASDALTSGGAEEEARRDPPLAEILDGSVTRQVMRADGVESHEVEAMMAELKKRQG